MSDRHFEKKSEQSGPGDEVECFDDLLFKSFRFFTMMMMNEFIYVSNSLAK